MLSISINCAPKDFDDHLKALGFMRRPVTAAEDQPQVEAPRIAGKSPELAALYGRPDGEQADDGKPAFVGIADLTPPNVLADELSALERPEDLAASPPTAGATRQRGQPSPGKKRRTKEELAEDLAYLQTPEGAKAAAEAPLISTGEPRIDPADAAQDAADEAAESAQRPAGPPTMDDLRAAVGRYTDKFGAEAGIKNMRDIIGCAMLQVPVDKIGDAIARVDLATRGSVVLGVGTEPNPAAPETSLFGDSLAAAPTATKADVVDSFKAYARKFDGTDDTAQALNTQADGSRILAGAFGDSVTRISLIPATPEGYGRAVAAIRAAIEGNPYERKVHHT